MKKKKFFRRPFSYFDLNTPYKSIFKDAPRDPILYVMIGLGLAAGFVSWLINS